jgi:hypothetical protein
MYSFCDQDKMGDQMVGRGRYEIDDKIVVLIERVLLREVNLNGSLILRQEFEGKQLHCLTEGIDLST